MKQNTLEYDRDYVVDEKAPEGWTPIEVRRMYNNPDTGVSEDVIITVHMRNPYRIDELIKGWNYSGRDYRGRQVWRYEKQTVTEDSDRLEKTVRGLVYGIDYAVNYDYAPNNSKATAVIRVCSKNGEILLADVVYIPTKDQRIVDSLIKEWNEAGKAEDDESLKWGYAVTD